MEALLKTGKANAIGVSNFNVRKLRHLLDNCTIKPATNRIEAHPYLQQQKLFDFCQKEGILIEAYSPLSNNQTGEPKTVDDQEVHAVGKSLGMDPGQVLVSWGVQRGTVVLPKSVTEKRIEGNFQDKVLSEAEMARLNALERHKRFNFHVNLGSDIYDEVGEKTVAQIAWKSGPANLSKFTV